MSKYNPTKKMNEYALEQMVNLVNNLRGRPIEFYSQKIKGQDKQFFLGKSFCDDLIQALEKQYKP